MVDALRLIALYRKINLLSIDVALGAVACSVFLARAFHTAVAIDPFIVLGITVWIIYTVDHLIDGHQADQHKLSPRHLFHRRHSLSLSIVVIVAMIINIILVVGLNRLVIVAGAIVLAMVILYFLIQSRVRGFKEFLCGLLYVAGILIIPLTGYQLRLNPYTELVTLQLFLVVLFNLLMFSWFDQSLDEANGWSSFATHFGQRTTKRILVSIFLAQLLVYLINLYLVDFRIVPAVLLVMNAILLVIFFRPHYFSVLDRYRLLGDAVFLLPVITMALR